MQTGDLVNLNDLVDWAMIFAVAFYLVAVVATELIRSLEATMRKRERRRRRQPHLQSRGRRAGRYALDVDAGLRAARKPHVATSNARTSREPTDLACTGRNQPMRISWAIPRASLRSVFIDIAESAALTCRVSKRTVSNPARVRPACNQ
jgi:hypothetical protein